jgi:hypothetical protein
MGLLRSLLGLTQGAQDDLDTANDIYKRAKDEGRELTPKEVDQINKLMDMREDKLDRAKDEGWTGLG